MPGKSKKWKEKYTESSLPGSVMHMKKFNEYNCAQIRRMIIPYRSVN